MHNLIRTGPFERTGRPGKECFDLSAFARLAGHDQGTAQLIDPFHHPGHPALPLSTGVCGWCEPQAVVADQQRQTLGHALQADQQVIRFGMAKNIGHRFLGDSKGGHRHFFRYAGQALMAFQAPVN